MNSRRSRRKSAAPNGQQSANSQGQENVVRVPHDSVNEMVLIAAVIVDEGARDQYLEQLPADMFYGTGHALIWRTLQQIKQKGLYYDPATLRQLGGPDIDVAHVETLIEQRPKSPPNLGHHVDMLHWDHARVSAAKGPVTRFLEMIKDPKTNPEELRNAAEAVAHELDSYKPRNTKKEWPDMLAAYDELKEERDWRYTGAIEGTPLVLFVAPEKSGKSWSLMQLTVATIAGKSWLGEFVCQAPGPVVYVDVEYGVTEFVRRVARICRGMGLDPREVLPHIRYYDNRQLTLCGDLLRGSSDSLSGREKEKRGPLLDLISRVHADPPKLIVLDPLRNMLPEGSENDAEVITSAFLALDRLRTVAGCPVVVAHHLNKSGNYSGSRSMLGRADLILLGSDEDEPWYAVRGRSVRHGDRIATRFSIRIVHQHDHDDAKAATLVAAKFEGGKGGELSPNAKRVLDALSAQQGPVSARKLSELVGRSWAITKRALEELESAGQAEVDGSSKWTTTLIGLWGDPFGECEKRDSSEGGATATESHRRTQSQSDPENEELSLFDAE